MKINRTKWAGLALAASATLTMQLSASTTFVAYNEGDLLLGFEQAGTANNLVVNIGSFSNYIPGGAYNTPGTPVVVGGLAVADLNSTFGPSWSTSTLRWGVAGRTADGTDTGSLKQNTLFLTKGESVAGVQSSPLVRYANSFQGQFGDNISGLGFTLTGILSTDNSTHSAVLDGSLGWTSYQDGTNSAIGFGYGANIEQPLTGSATGPTNSVLDLYQLNNTSNTAGTSGSSPGIYLGSFALNSAGVLTFSAVPEPSTYALVALGLGSLFIIRRLKGNDAALKKVASLN